MSERRADTLNLAHKQRAVEHAIQTCDTRGQGVTTRVKQYTQQHANGGRDVAMAEVAEEDATTAEAEARRREKGQG